MATAASIQAVQEAYIAYYGRPGDPAGIDFWAERLDAAGGNTSAMISAFGTSSEASARYASLSVTDAVNAIYNQVLGRDAEAGATGIDFYVNKVLSGEFTLVTLAQNVWDGATSGTDAQTVANKLTAANSFTQTLRDDAAANTAYAGDNAAGNARNWLRTVDETEASVTNASSSIAATIAALADTPSNPGTAFTLTTGTDSFSGTSLDDTFTATGSGVLATADTLLDATSTDRDVLNANVSSNSLAPKLTNIEVLNISGNFITTGIALTNVSGATELNLSTGLADGTATVTDANSLNAASINAGSNVANLRVTSLSSGTRDSVVIDLGAASGSLTLSDSGADKYTVAIGDGKSLSMVSAGASDVITLSNSGGDEFTIRTSDSSGSALASLVVNASGDLTVNSVGGFGSGVTVNGGGIVTLHHSGSSTTLDSLVVGKSGVGTLILDIGQAAVATDLSLADVDTVRLATSGVSAVAINVKEGVVVEFASDTHASNAITLDVGTGSAVDATGSIMINLDHSSVGPVIIGSSAISLLIQTVTGDATGKISSLTTVSATEAIQIYGSENVTLTSLTATDGTIVTASSLTGKLNVTTTDALLIYGGSNNDTISLTGTGTVVGNAGADTITINGTSGPVTVSAGEGDDIVVATAGSAAHTISLGDGADTVRMTFTASDARSTISDFVVGTDVLAIKGTSAIDVTTVSISSGIVQLGGASVTLTSVTATDFSDSIQLGWSISDSLNLTTHSAATVVGGNNHDYITTGSLSAAQSITLGSGSDTLVLLGTGYTSTQSATVTDFLVGTDKIVLVGSAQGTTVIDAYSVSLSSGLFTFGSANIILKNGGSALTDDDLSTSLQFGWSGSAANWYVTDTNTATLTLGTSDDFVNVAGPSSTVIIKNGGGLDFIEGSATTILNYGNLTGIGTAESYQTADAARVSDAVSGTTYIFQNGENGAGSSSLEFSGSMSGGAVAIADVAAWLDLNLNVASGEKFVAIINDTSSTSANAYYVDVVGELDADDLTLISMLGFAVGLANITNT